MEYMASILDAMCYFFLAMCDMARHDTDRFVGLNIAVILVEIMGSYLISFTISTWKVWRRKVTLPVKLLRFPDPGCI